MFCVISIFFSRTSARVVFSMLEAIGDLRDAKA